MKRCEPSPRPARAAAGTATRSCRRPSRPSTRAGTYSASMSTRWPASSWFAPDACGRTRRFGRTACRCRGHDCQATGRGLPSRTVVTAASTPRFPCDRSEPELRRPIVPGSRFARRLIAVTGCGPPGPLAASLPWGLRLQLGHHQLIEMAASRRDDALQHPTGLTLTSNICCSRSTRVDEVCYSD